MMIIRKKLAASEISPDNQRYNADCDCTQTFINGSWVDNPNVDPRTSTAMLLPPTSASDPKCSAATGIVDNFRSGLSGALTAIDAAASAAAGASFILTFLDFLDGLGIIVQLIIDFCALIIGIGTTAVSAAFTDSVYDHLHCIVYCNLEDDGTCTQDDLNNIGDDVRDAFGGLSTVAVIFEDWIENLGFVGITNIGVVKATTGDCSDCFCGSILCVGFDDGDPFTIISFGHGTTFADATVDDTFGNPLPSLEDGKGMSGGESGFGVAVEIDLGAAVHVLTTTFDYFYVRNDFATLYIEIQWLDAAHGLVATENQTVSTSFSAWHSYVAPSVDYSSVRYVQVYAAGSSFIFTSGDCWVDNVCIEYE